MDFREILRRITETLDASGIQYMLVGSFAASYYGYFRATADIDFVIDANPEQLQKFIQELKNRDYEQMDDALAAWRNRSMFNVMDRPAAWKIDFIFLKPRPYSSEEFRRRKQGSFEGVPLVVASPEDVIVAKLEWAKLGESARQIEDVARLLAMIFEKLDLNYISGWVKELGLINQWSEARRLARLEYQSFARYTLMF